MTSPVRGTSGPTTSLGQFAATVGTKPVATAASDQAGNTSTSTAQHAATRVPELSAVRGDYWWTQSNVAMGDGRASRTDRVGASMTYASTGHGVGFLTVN